MILSFCLVLALSLVFPALTFGSRESLTIEAMTEKYKNTCYGSANISELDDTKKKLKAFSEGPCNPMLVIPGVGATRLQLRFTNCSLFQSKYPDYFQICGWTTCDKNYWLTHPEKEYAYWLPNIFSPMSILLFSNKTEACFGLLGQMAYEQFNSSSNPMGSSHDLDGLEITWLGNTPETESLSQCGLEAISDLLPTKSLQMGWTFEFKILADFLKATGHINGLTVQFLPYDFRKPLQKNDVHKSFVRAIEYLNGLTGKKVVVFSHSFGNLNTLFNLNNMTRQKKEKLIQHWVSIGGPFTGVAKGLLPSLGGDDEFFFTVTGLNYFSAFHFLGTMFSRYIMVPRNTYFKNQNETWMKNMLLRVKLEKEHPPNSEEGRQFWGKINETNPEVLEFFPSPLEECVLNFTDRPGGFCITGLENMLTEPVMIYNFSEQNYTASMDDILSLFEEWSINPEMDLSLTYWGQEDGLNDLVNPEVPVSLIYGGFMETDMTYEYDSDPTPNMNKWKYYEPDETYSSLGDGTVNVHSCLLAGFKWSWEHAHDNKNGSAKPVNIVEYCSSFQEATTPYDSIDEFGVRELNENHYIGLGCECLSQDNGGDTETGYKCAHSYEPVDPYVILFGFEAALTGESADFLETKGESFDAMALEELIEDCWQLRADWNVSAQEIFDGMTEPRILNEMNQDGNGDDGFWDELLPF